MKKIVLVLAMSLFVLSTYGQNKFFGGVAYSNVGPRAQFGLLEHFEKGEFDIKSTISYIYELSHQQPSFDTFETVSRTHIAVSSIILFDVKQFKLGGGVSYRYITKANAGIVGLSLCTIYSLNDKYEIEGTVDKMANGITYASLGLNFRLF